MNDLAIINDAIVIKEVFGTFAILDKFEVYDIPSVIEFATIVYNYTNMQRILNENRKIQPREVKASESVVKPQLEGSKPSGGTKEKGNSAE